MARYRGPAEEAHPGQQHHRHNEIALIAEHPPVGPLRQENISTTREPSSGGMGIRLKRPSPTLSTEELAKKQQEDRPPGRLAGPKWNSREPIPRETRASTKLDRRAGQGCNGHPLPRLPEIPGVDRHRLGPAHSHSQQEEQTDPVHMRQGVQGEPPVELGGGAPSL